MINCRLLNHKWLAVAAWLLVLIGWVGWSYGLVDGNLTLINNQIFWAWQTWSWHWAANALLASRLYVGITLGLLASTAWLWVWLRQAATAGQRRWWLIVLLVGSAILLLGQNALSHDIFNYIFNAKMLAVYGADPHYHVALEFSHDLWLRFMHNVHTPAPYGHGWTYWSVIPFFLSGLGKSFLLTLVTMRVWMWLGWVVFLWCVWQLVHEKFPANTAWQRWALLAFQPVVLIEALLNGHNDVWFMVPALLAMWVVTTRRPPLRLVPRWWLGLAAAALLALSMWMKIATVVLVPVLAALIIEPWCVHWPSWWRWCVRQITAHWAEWSALALLLPLLLPRSQQFYPWYLVWALAFWPLVEWQWLRWLIAGLAVSALFRYIPWLLNAQQYDNATLLWMKVLSFSGILAVPYYWWRKISSPQHV
jgi:hypothetical protein